MSDAAPDPRDERVEQVFGNAVELYAVLDGARDDRIAPLLASQPELQHCSLYDGDEGRALAHWGPHLVCLHRDAVFTSDLLARAWGQSWGVFFQSPASMDEVRAHLRRFLTVETEDGRAMYFRFYDPRVLRVWLHTCESERRAAFFGPIQQFVIEPHEGETPLRYSIVETMQTQEKRVVG